MGDTATTEAATATTTTSTDGTTTTTEVSDTQTTETVDHAAEAEKWKTLAQKHEQRAKANAEAAKELATLKQQSMSDVEKAVDQAKSETRTSVLREIGGRLVDAELKAALVGKTLTPEALLSFDRSTFITDDGDVDGAAISKWVEKNTTTDGGTTSFDGGARTTSAAPKSMSDLIRKQAGLSG